LCRILLGEKDNKFVKALLIIGLVFPYFPQVYFLVWHLRLHDEVITKGGVNGGESIFTSRFTRYGKKGQIVDVAEGYARNYLFKNNLAILADENSLNR